MNSGRKGLIKPAGPVDPEVSFLHLRAPDGRHLALLANYGLHYVGGGKRGHVSADYYGMFADRMTELLDAQDQSPPFLAILSNGASGDVNANDDRKPRVRYPAWERMELVADHVASTLLPAVQEASPRDGITLAAAETVLDLQVRKPDTARLAWARQTAAPKGTLLRLSRAQVYAREALALHEFPDTVPVRIQAFRMGDLAVVSIPCEVFAETGLAIKEESPLEHTFLIELANGYHGYLPTPRQHEWGGYETWPARSSRLEADAEPKIRSAALELLHGLAKPRN